MESINVRVRYFAVLRERRGTDAESVQTSVATALDLYRELSQRHALRLDESLIRFALNGEFVPGDTPLREGSELALIPPVAGG